MTPNPKAAGPWPRQKLHTPARTVVAPTGGTVRGRFPSTKARRMVAFEQLLELDLLFLSEFADQVVDIHEQPFKLNYAHGNKIRRYTPDFALTLRDGDILIVEVKPSRSLAKTEIWETLLHIREAMERQGHRFIVMSSDTIRAQPRLDNLKRLHRYLLRELTPERRRSLQQLRTRHAVQSVLPMKYLGHELAGMANVLSLLAHGYLSCDLSQPLSPDTLISLFKKEADYVFVDSLQ